MIQAKDLIINNWVNEEVLGNCLVASISQNTVVLLTNNMKVDRTIEVVEYTISIGNLRGIELTEDILLNCGAKKRIKSYYKYKIGNLLIGSDFKMIAFGNAVIIGLSVTYLHELQNLVYILTKKEIEYKP